jgi:hypothetical protein
VNIPDPVLRKEQYEHRAETEQSDQGLEVDPDGHGCTGVCLAMLDVGAVLGVRKAMNV